MKRKQGMRKRTKQVSELNGHRGSATILMQALTKVYVVAVRHVLSFANCKEELARHNTGLLHASYEKWAR